MFDEIILKKNMISPLSLRMNQIGPHYVIKHFVWLTHLVYIILPNQLGAKRREVSKIFKFVFVVSLEFLTCLEKQTKSMASAAKKAKYNSVVDEVISTVRRSYFGKPVDDEFLNFLKSLLENKMAASEEGHSSLFD